eukprot:TRINITY_DN16072_c0_g1_i1.p2 TRINITY_DN16072_c0_g1~~TRINITY_DN16072_c0_g1_i1.p2  ORF type:complete len:228 (+),score=52.59 TRINITY_DN16072_c0_g1_i1:90-773(+)
MTSPRIHCYNTERSNHWKRWVERDARLQQEYRHRRELKEELRREWRRVAGGPKWDQSDGEEPCPPLFYPAPPRTAPAQQPRGSAPPPQVSLCRDYVHTDLHPIVPAPPPNRWPSESGVPWSNGAALSPRRPNPSAESPAACNLRATAACSALPLLRRAAPPHRKPPPRVPRRTPAAGGASGSATVQRLGTLPIAFFRCADDPVSSQGEFQKTTVVRDHLGQVYSFYE